MAYSVWVVPWGAGACGALLSVGTSTFVAALVASTVLVILLVVSARHFLSDRASGGFSLTAIPRGIVLVLGLLCFIVFLVEGRDARLERFAFDFR